MTQKAQGHVAFEHVVRDRDPIVIVVEPDMTRATVRVTAFSDWTEDAPALRTLTGVVARIARGLAGAAE